MQDMCPELYDDVSASGVATEDNIRWRDALIQQVSECHIGLIQLSGERIIGHHRMLQNGDAEVAQGSRYSILDGVQEWKIVGSWRQAEGPSKEVEQHSTLASFLSWSDPV